MKKEQAIQIEKKHNVHVDAETEQYTHGDRDDEYGWLPIPDEWVKDTTYIAAYVVKELRVQGYTDTAIKDAMCDGEALEELGIPKEIAEEIYNHLDY